MRKVLSFVLVLTLVLSSFSMAFAATPADVKGTPNAEAVEVLMGLGVVNGYPDGTFKPENIVTRAEMAKMIVVALGLQDYATGTSKFTDMAGATWAQGYVNYANGLGIVKGYPDGTFKPSQTVSYDEASAMIVRALGYTDSSLLPATWPSNYVVKAKALGILDGVKSSALGANRGDIAKMVFNALTVAIGTVDADNKWNANSDDKDAPDNFLVRLGAEFHDADVVYGTEDSTINLVPYTGKWAETYTNDDDEIVAVDVQSDGITGDYDANEGTTGAGIVNASTDDDTDYNVTAKIAGKEVPLFFNGVQEGSASIDTESSATGHLDYAVDLSGKRIDASYSISYWAVTEDGLFTKDDAEDIADEDAPSLFSIDFILDDDDAIDNNQFELLGADSLSDIDVDNVVYVYDGGDGIKKIAVGTEVVTGKVTEEDDGTYTINGKEYDLATEEVASQDGLTAADKFKVGDTITARLDYFGYIYDVELDSSTPDTYAIVKGYLASDDINDAKAKLYTSEDATKTFTVDEDVTDTITKGNLIGYGLDKDGVIDSVNTDVDTATTARLVSSKVLNAGGKTYPIDSDAVVFTVDNDGDYGVTTIKNIDTDTPLVGTGEDDLGTLQMILDDGYVVAMLVDKELAGAGSDETYAVINKIVTAIDSDDEAIQKMTGFIDKTAATKYTDNDDTILGYDDEDIILWNLSVNADGIITDASKVVDSEDVNVTSGAIKDLNDDKTAVQIGTTWNTLADNVIVYFADSDEGYTYYVKSNSSLQDGYYLYLYDTDEDNDGYEYAIYKKEGLK